jgi:uracil-DNA glycosylase family 4
MGAEVVGYDEVSLGTGDYTTIIQKVRAAKPDVFISAQFAADAVALLKQCYEMGLNKEMTIFNSFITNVVKCRPPGNRDPRPDDAHIHWEGVARALDISLMTVYLVKTRLGRELKREVDRLREHGNF